MNEELKKAISEIDAIVHTADSKSLSKSNEGETMDELLKTIRELGPDGLRKALPNLSEPQKELLNEVLSKAKDMTKPAQMDDNKKPQKAREPVTEERSNSEEGVDEADEKLMADSNKTQNHQGGPDTKTPGWEGQVIKSDVMDLSTGMEKSGDMLKAKREQAKEKIMDMEEKEHGTKDPEKIVAEEKKEHQAVNQLADIKKSEGEEELEKLEKSELLSKMVERMRKRGMHRGKCMEAMKKKGYDCDMADKLWEDQEKMEKASSEKKIEKSIPWRNPQAELLGARTLGRNASYSVTDELLKSEARRDELKKSNETFYDGISAPLKKSEGKMDINDMLEKGLDRDELKHAEELRTVKPSGAFTVSSFSEEDFAKAWPASIAEGNKKLSNKQEKSDEEKDKAKAEKQESDQDKK